MASSAGAPRAIRSEFGGHRYAVVVQADWGKGVGRMTGTAVVVARDVSRVLAHGFDAVVATEAGASYLQVIHANDRQEVVLGVAGFAVVLREDVCHRPGS
jgi:mRNA-degrading endonuclease toxin of MazEF toxin-antitoxin module